MKCLNIGCYPDLTNSNKDVINFPHFPLSKIFHKTKVGFCALASFFAMRCYKCFGER